MLLEWRHGRIGTQLRAVFLRRELRPRHGLPRQWMSAGGGAVGLRRVLAHRHSRRVGRRRPHAQLHDLDDDGFEELTVVSETEIRVYEAPWTGSAPPVTTARSTQGPATNAAFGPVGTNGAPALVLLTGAGGTTTLEAWVDTGALVLAIDGGAAVVHHPAGAVQSYALGSSIVPGARSVMTERAWGGPTASSWSATPTPSIEHVAAWLPPGFKGDSNPLFLVMGFSELVFLDTVDGDISSISYPYLDKPLAQFVAVAVLDQPYLATNEKLAAGDIGYVVAFNLSGPVAGSGVKWEAALVATTAADLDGDDEPELAFATNSSVGFVDGMTEADPATRCVAELPFNGVPVALDAGDIDQDGLDELVVLTDSGDVVLIQ